MSIHRITSGTTELTTIDYSDETDLYYVVVDDTPVLPDVPLPWDEAQRQAARERAESPDAMDLAEEHRQLISRWFYECSYEIHTGLADMYLADERFMATYENIKLGLTQYLHDAIHANAVDRA